VTASVGMFSSDNPSIYSPLFIMKKSFNLKNSKGKMLFRNDSAHLKEKGVVIFRAPEYWFKKNINFLIDTIDNLLSDQSFSYTTVRMTLIFLGNLNTLNKTSVKTYLKKKQTLEKLDFLFDYL
jgi:hypothetical protein